MNLQRFDPCWAPSFPFVRRPWFPRVRCRFHGRWGLRFRRRQGGVLAVVKGHAAFFFLVFVFVPVVGRFGHVRGWGRGRWVVRLRHFCGVRGPCGAR